MPWHKALRLYYKNKNVKLQYVKKEDWLRYKTSDTLFIFGSGPSINEIKSSQWDIIRKHDTMGLNHALLVKEKMTYYYLGYEPSSNQGTKKIFRSEIRKIYENTLWFLPTKVIYRLYHPRIIPEFFPPNPKIGIFDYPEAISLDSDRPFKKEDFQKSLVYRGVMCLGLYFADLLGYKNIVLLGVDLDTYRHFFDDYEITKYRKWYNEYMEKKTGGPFESMIPKGNKYRTMEEYYYKVNELYFQPKGVNLYVGNKDNMLCPRINLFPKFNLSSVD